MKHCEIPPLLSGMCTIDLTQTQPVLWEWAWERLIASIKLEGDRNEIENDH